jgi:choline dehydrogenase-like flavoprotein
MSERPDPFDVVIVGAGAAGCVLAARLAESASRSVLLLEAGPDLRTDTPPEFRDGWGLPRKVFDWGFLSEPDFRGEPQNLARKRVVGGTSWLTRFVVRGSPTDFDNWAARGNAGWGWKEVLPSFIKLESDRDFGDEPWHGDSGPIPVDRYLDAEPSEMETAALAALEAAGFPLVDDHNRPGAVGAGRMPMNSRGGRRVTTADAYLPVGVSQPNLTLRPDAQVDAVLLQGTTATGVRLVDGTTIEAGRVVLSAGTYGSPPILLRSGVGPAAHLRSLDIPVAVDLPGVGSNLADHPAAYLETEFPGPVREVPLLHTIATFGSSASTDGVPDLLLWASESPGNPPAFGLEAVLMKPNCRGTVRLRSADPAEAPVIRLPDRTEPADEGRLVEGYLRALEVAGHPEVARRVPGLTSGASTDGDSLREFVRTNSYSIPHVVGTCAMGPSPDAGAVVDTSGRVHGIDGLSVVDASIIPESTAGFPHVVAIMMAERLAEQLS